MRNPYIDAHLRLPTLNPQPPAPPKGPHGTDFLSGRAAIRALRFFLALAVAAMVMAGDGLAADTQSAANNDGEREAISRIRTEGLDHSQVMETLSYLTEVIGPRLTASPALKQANEWTRDKMASWGLTNAHLEAWGPFGRGWTLKKFSAQVVEPQCFPLLGYPSAWSPGLDQPLTAEVVYLDAANESDLKQYEGKLKGAIVLVGPTRDARPGFEPLATRVNETNLLSLANAGVGNAIRYSFAMGNRGAVSRATLTNRFRSMSPFRAMGFLAKEGAALVVTPSMMGEEGTFAVASAQVPMGDFARTNADGSRTNVRSFFGSSTRAWATNAPPFPPQITLALEDYNRLVRMIQNGAKPKMAVEFQAQFNDDDLMAYNTIAEIPGSDKKDEIVMLGAHIDSWHAGTGATDDGAGVAACMEAARIITTLKLHPRRTIRIGLWAGEEQGLLGSQAYVTSHLGYYTNVAVTNLPAPNIARNSASVTNASGTNASGGPVADNALRSPKDESPTRPILVGSFPRPSWISRVLGGADSGQTNSRPASAGSSATTRKLVRLAEYDKFSAYFNLDNGGGKIRGIYMQSNEALRPWFRDWLEPFRDVGAETVTASNTGGTDHLPFDDIGLPGFQFIQDPLDYGTRTHHTNQDVYDRIIPDDLKQASVILAAFAYDAAMADDKLPRKASAGRN